MFECFKKGSNCLCVYNEELLLYNATVSFQMWMNVRQIHLCVVQMPTARIKKEVTTARAWKDLVQQSQISPSAAITYAQVSYRLTFVFSLMINTIFQTSIIVICLL